MPQRREETVLGHWADMLVHHCRSTQQRSARTSERNGTVKATIALPAAALWFKRLHRGHHWHSLKIFELHKTSRGKLTFNSMNSKARNQKRDYNTRPQALGSLNTNGLHGQSLLHSSYPTRVSPRRRCPRRTCIPLLSIPLLVATTAWYPRLRNISRQNLIIALLDETFREQ